MKIKLSPEAGIRFEIHHAEERSADTYQEWICYDRIIPSNTIMKTENSTTKNYWLYVLKLEHKKMYVGITTKTPEIRFKEHLNWVRPAKWTMKYKPLSIFYTKYLGNITKEHAEEFERITVRRYISKYGINTVRGGDLTDKEDYIIRFGYIRDKESYTTALVIIFLLLIIIILATRLR